MASRRKTGLDPSSLDAIVEKTDSIKDLLREAKNLPLEKVIPNPEQPRKTFDTAALDELRESIRSLGVMIPILVRPADTGYQIICGERRFRVAQELGLPSIPAIVHKVDDFKALRMAYEENVKREDLTAIDEARFLSSLIERGMVKNRQDLAETLGVSKGRISQKLAVLTLPQPIQRAFETHAFLGEFHARSLAQLEDPKVQEKVLSEVVKQQLSGRQTEALVQRHRSRPVTTTRPRRSRVEFEDAVLRRDATGFTLHLPVLNAQKLSELLIHLARAIRDQKVKLPRD